MRFAQPGAFGPGIAWQIVSAENFIDKQEYGCKVFAIVPRVFAMVPVMVLGRGKNIFQEAKVDAGVCMNEHRMNGHENDIGIKSDLRKSKNIQGNKGHWPGYKDVYKMGPWSGQPIHIFCGMVYGMEAPQVGVWMEKAMGGILKKVGDQEGEEKLNNIRKLLHPMLDLWQSDPSKK